MHAVTYSWYHCTSKCAYFAKLIHCSFCAGALYEPNAAQYKESSLSKTGAKAAITIHGDT